tara:strand:- start:341 stop:1294 length:954 start_codon:yes stop_codon:yes gene_type:complete
LPDWARAHGSPLYAATIRSTPADFGVTEELGYDFDGNGEHDFLYLEKVGTNTEWLARQLARFAGVTGKDVGYSGLKDRDATTRQWFSVPRWHAPDWGAFGIDGVTVRDVQRHSKKLRRGAHKANHFRIVLRGPKVGSLPIDERLALISEQGVPNYYGPQRFGRDGANLNLANAWASGKRLPRHKRSIAISSARSFLFNGTLQQRVLDGSWNRLLSGDIANLDGTGSVFAVEAPDQALEQRCRELDIHPAVQLPGDGSNCANDAWQKAFDKARVKAGSRSLRLRVRDLQAHDSDNSITLSFTLGRGAFATSVLREIIL